jgi:hypothetical protein
MVSLNSINYNSNQHRESFPYELDKIHPKMLQRDSVLMMVMKVLVMMMMIPMKPSSMMVTMAMISPLREGISLANFYLTESFLSLCVFRPAEAVESICDPSRVLGFRGDDIRKGAMAEVGQGGHTSIFQRNMNFWVFSWNCWSSEIWCLDSPFSSRILTPAVNSPIIIKHAK